MRQRRQALGLTQLELALLMRVESNRVGEWERGKHAPNLATLAKIARALDTSTDYLLGVTDEAIGQDRPRV